jgi:hypothetical protein
MTKKLKAAWFSAQSDAAMFVRNGTEMLRFARNDRNPATEHLPAAVGGFLDLRAAGA